MIRQTLDDAAAMDRALTKARSKRAMERSGRKPVGSYMPDAERDRRKKARQVARAARRRNRR
jgi:hypothetical protein